MAGALSFEEVLALNGFFVYTIKGISMRPLLRQGRDLVVITARNQDRLQLRDMAFFKRDNGEYVIHRVLKMYPDGYGICGDNQAFIEYVREDQVLGVVTTIERNNKLIATAVTEKQKSIPFGYRLYVHLWCDLFVLRAFLVKIEYKLIALYRRLKNR